MADQPSEKVAQAKLIQAVRDLIKREEDIRAECGVGDNLRVVRNKLQALLKDLEANVNLSLVEEEAETSNVSSEASVNDELDDNHAIVYLDTSLPTQILVAIGGCRGSC